LHEARRILALPDGFDLAEPSETSDATVKRISHLFGIYKELFGVCGGDDAAIQIWIRSPNHALAGRAPVELMISGQEEDLVEVRSHLGSRRREWA
jgi:uncharacterized protein (DUF2384 family)